jgi:hypothetical protein
MKDNQSFISCFIIITIDWTTTITTTHFFKMTFLFQCGWRNDHIRFFVTMTFVLPTFGRKNSAAVIIFFFLNL